MQEALQSHPTPSECPQNRLFVSPDVWSIMLQLGYSSKVDCHLGYHRILALLQQCFFTTFPQSENNTTFPTVVDRLSEAVHFVPLVKIPSALETANLMVIHVFCLHGIPQDVVLD